MRDPVHMLRALGGVARKVSVIEAGISSYAIDMAIRAGYLLRPRRGWVALPDADPYLIAAARAGVVLTCITRAKRLGLWVLDEDGPHVGVAQNASRLKLASPTATVHWSRPAEPRPAGTLEDGILNTLVMVAACQPHETALAVWDSALNVGLVEKAELERLPLTGAVRRVLDEATPFADSGLETIFRTRLRWLRHPIRSQIWIHGHRLDFLIGERLAVQIDGGHHVGQQRSEDVAHDAALMLLGFHVIRFTYGQVIDHWPDVQEQIMRAVAQGLHRAA
ncbi:endonuclease domain-containing protein [Microbacterium sp. SSM24]|uniref:endonuclease domain-containing protein n=1 Tax=Microbacterium sp. SSM24 TaxID=2991714 RepID=UPI002227279D|nr:type IV toxin-antitoxin system AbiEi family antitoxin domain-containing protein [Microbacterium sp. SSM24]MCW3491959.1 endonuclease domain-containing protein [Microbacterium sp. SSM24]